MQDLQTESLWSQVTGECIKGEMEGTALEQIPAIHTTFKDFAEEYPDGKLLKKPAKGKHGSGYSDYFSDESRLGIFGRADTFEKLKAKEKVYGLRLESGPAAVSENYLVWNSFALLDDEKQKIIVTYDSTGQTASAFKFPRDIEPTKDKLKINNNKLSFEDNIWDINTGQNLSDNAESLTRVPLITAFWFAWASFFPETELIKH